MRIIITSNITSNSKTNCLKCSEPLRIYGVPNKISCGCGAHYELMSSKIVEPNVEMEYEFKGFVCVFSNYSTTCFNPCPSPNMYCRTHCSDEAIESAKKDIKYAEGRVADTKEKLETLEASKKNWLVSDLGGLSDEPV